MPAVSVDTFFACSLMVIIALSAMAGASKLLSPYISNNIDHNTAKRYEEISKYILLNSGKPSNWGQDGQALPETFGLARVDSGNLYELDVDKVSRLNSENVYALNYAELFGSLGLFGVAFRLEVNPIFSTTIDLTGAFPSPTSTVYQFKILTEKDGFSVSAELKCYIIAEDYFDTTGSVASSGRLCENVTIPSTVNGPALLIAFAQSSYNNNVVSYGTYTFAHNSAPPTPKGTFMKLSPLNYSLAVSFTQSQLNLSRAYALTYNFNSTSEQTSTGNQSATYEIPRFLDPGPIVIAVTGVNSTVFFTEWTAYPQLPLQAGADFTSSKSLSNVFAYTYPITINLAMYECTVWLGGPGE